MKFISLALILCFSQITLAGPLFIAGIEALSSSESFIEIINYGKEASFVDTFQRINKHQSPSQNRIELEAGEKKFLAISEIVNTNTAVIYFLPDLLNQDSLSIRWLTNTNTEKEFAKAGNQFLLKENRSYRITNLSPVDNDIDIGNARRLKLSAYQSLNIDLEDEVYLSSERPLAVMNLASELFLSPMSSDDQTENTSYFVFSNGDSESSFSYSIAVKNENLKRQLRMELAKEWQQRKLINGKITPGGMTNQQRTSGSYWSWSLKDIEMTDFGGNFCNLHPAETEIFLAELLNSEARFCNWSFRVIREEN